MDQPDSAQKEAVEQSDSSSMQQEEHGMNFEDPSFHCTVTLVRHIHILSEINKTDFTTEKVT